MEKETYQEIISWKTQIRDALKSFKDFTHYALSLGYEEYLFKKIPEDLSLYPLFIPKNLATEILRLGPDSMLWKQFIPNIQEFSPTQLGLLDPIGDQKNFVAPQLIHRYQNRVLFLPTHLCPVQCRYCFRKNELHDTEFKQEFLLHNFPKTLEYLYQHPEIEEIIFTGGDPLFLDNDKLSFFLEEFSKIHHIQFIRFHTRFPSILPKRIDQALTELFIHYSHRFTISMMIHTNHQSEWFSQDHFNCLKQLQALPIHLGSQTVLLKDHTQEDLVQLFKFLIQHHIKPYYLHHPDQVQGAMHFHLSKTDGIHLYKSLRQKLPGWAIPHYVEDSSLGEEKKLVLSN
jgi:lysine 2,3-aminomutase